jgi:hypothetical protein
MTQDWTIQSRGHSCTATAREFLEGESFYTLLFDEKNGYRREDLCEEAWKARPADAPAPYSFWKTKYTPPPPPAPEALGKQTAEDLLRAYMAGPLPESGEKARHMAAARYLLAVMLERKRILKEVEVKRGEDGTITRIYEHGKSGEVFVVPDPQLRLDEIEHVQGEVASLLAPAPVVSGVEPSAEIAEPPPSDQPAEEPPAVESTEPGVAPVEQLAEKD